MDKVMEGGNNCEVLQEDGLEINSHVVFTPEVKDECIPKLGQVFSSLDEVQEFYKNYARHAGFGIRLHSSARSTISNEIRRKEYVCYKEGKKATRLGSEPQRRRGDVREGCKAKVVVLKSKVGRNYVISQFVEGHNHALTTPRSIHLLRSHRDVSEAKKSLTQLLGSVNIPTYQQFSVLEAQACGIENIGCTQKDIYNFERDLRNDMKGHDAEMLVEHFVAAQAINESFIFKTEADEDNRLKHFFWADAISRRAYGFYGDVVVFDTTYNTNCYGMIFAPLVGVNNHGQTIILACAFLSNESTDSFVWLFDQLKKAMPGDPPKVIITDQDAAISKAIALALPTTIHRYCIWHILNKFSDKLSPVHFRDHYKKFKNCIQKSITTEEFESEWVQLVEKSGLTVVEKEWLESIYGLRKKWVPAFVKHVFSAGMSSSQRVESSHAFFKKYVSRKNTLMHFITRFDRALVRQRHLELSADHVDTNEQAACKTPYAMEKQMAKIYTRNKFYQFQDELWKSCTCLLELIRKGDDHSVYKVAERKKDGSSKMREIVHSNVSNQAICNCNNFEFHGIPCRHLLAYLKMKQVEYLPNEYILRRWTKSAKTDMILDSYGNEMKDCVDSSLLMRRSNLCGLASRVIDDALVSKEACDALLDTFEAAHARVKFLVGIDGGVSRCSKNVEIVGSSIEREHLKDPVHVRAKGSGKRLKGGKEKAMERLKRHCNECRATTHDKRTCPKLKTSSLPCQVEEPSSSYFNDSLLQEFDRTYGPRL